MCDYIAGELILGFPRFDNAAQTLIEEIKLGHVEHVNYDESLKEKLERLGLKQSEALEFEFHRVFVPVGEEQFKINYLHFFYKTFLLIARDQGSLDPQLASSLGYSKYQFIVSQNSILTLASRPLGTKTVSASNFTFSSYHSHYRSMLAIPNTPIPDLDKVSIVIVDSGIANDVNFPISYERNFVGGAKNINDVEDENGHGTVVSLIIQDLAPNANLKIFKVADANGRADEWDTLAALSTNVSSHIVNLSLEFGLEDRYCNVCGRQSHSSRSMVFESMVNQYQNLRFEPLLIAAAGNDSKAELDFPARYPSMVSIGAINSRGEKTFESNFGYQYNAPGSPDNRFVAPGGDDNVNPMETIGSFGQNDDPYWHGTSFAAAYTTGVVANLIAKQRLWGGNRNLILNSLRQNADTQHIFDYKTRMHGHGLIML